jgi:ribosomal protein S20
MKNRKKVLTVAAIVLLAAGLAAGLVLAQESDEETVSAPSTTTETGTLTLMGRVAAILGIDEETLADAFQQARIERIDDAVAEGLITAEEAAALKARIEARSALEDVLDEAIAAGKLTEEQLESLRGRGLSGQDESIVGRSSRGRASGGFGFSMQTPRGTARGGFWSCQP